MSDYPAPMQQIAREKGVDPAPMTLFYYEVFGKELDETTRGWPDIEPDGPVHLTLPLETHLSGFDACCFSQRNAPECSPLSCNRLCSTVAVNTQPVRHTRFDDAKNALNRGVFDLSEPGPYQIFAVYTVSATASG